MGNHRRRRRGSPGGKEGGAEGAGSGKALGGPWDLKEAGKA